MISWYRNRGQPLFCVLLWETEIFSRKCNVLTFIFTSPHTKSVHAISSNYKALTKKKLKKEKKKVRETKADRTVPACIKSEAIFNA